MFAQRSMEQSEFRRVGTHSSRIIAGKSRSRSPGSCAQCDGERERERERERGGGGEGVE
jgi:hypothetical protein